MKADALMRFILSGNRSLEGFAALLARISLGVFFAISGGNKLFVASQYKLMNVVAPEEPDRAQLLGVVRGRARVKPDASRLRAARGWRA